MVFAAVMLLALSIEAAAGWPDRLYDRIGHPVTWMGAAIDACDNRFNREGDSTRRRRLMGVGVVLVLCGAVFGGTTLLVWLLPGGWIGVLLTGILAWPLVAARSLHDHVRAVALPLAKGDLPAARTAVSMIVGRDPERLDGAGVGRAALESLGESTSDGVVAPLFWGVLLGLPGIATYKMINTMDSMIGHLSPRHAAFGWAAARLDDLVNLIPARLSGVLIAAVSGRWRHSLSVMLLDAGKHRSPNAGWPEAALAGALDVRLSGPRVYDNLMSDEPWVNAGAPDPGALDVARGLEVYLKAMALLAAILLGLSFI
jgi:adenosylcobinamide-phosphate synthase